MSIQIIPQPTTASAIGSSLGQAVSEYLPKELDRYRLRRGLENLRQENITDPYQLTAKLATTPGMDPGLLGILAPLLQSQIGRQQAGKGFGQPSGFPTQGQTPGVEATQPGAIAQGVSAGEPKLTPLGKNVPEVEPINQLSNNLLRYQPFTYRTPQEATAEAERRIANVEAEFDKQTASFLQKGKQLQEGEIGGDVLDLMRQKAVQELATTGKSERSIAQKYARQAKEIAKEYSHLRQVNASTGRLNRPNQSTIKSIRETGQRLSNLGIPEDQIIDNTKNSLDVSRGAAEYLLNPLHGTEAGKAMHGAKKLQFITGAIERSQGAERKLAEKIAPLITSEDMIGSLAYIAQQKGYNGQRFVSELSQLIPQKIKDRLSTTQIRDLGSPQNLSPALPPLNQLWLMRVSGEQKEARK